MDGTGLEGRGERIWGNMGGYGGIYMGKYGGVCVNKGVDVTGLEEERGGICVNKGVNRMGLEGGV